MKFLETYLKLQETNENYIVLMRNGIFFLAIGKSAVALNKMINLKVICMRQEMCKIGIPVKNINKYIMKIAEQKKSFVLYDYCKEGFPEEGLRNYKELFRLTADDVKEERKNIDCNTCWYKERRIANNWKEEIKKIEKELKHDVIFTKTKQEAKETLENIRNFLEEELKLTLNQKTQIFKNKQGVNFCGYKIKEYRLKIRDRGKRKLKKKIKYLTKEIKEGRMTSKEAKRYLCGHIGYINTTMEVEVEWMKR